jgi:hypothetical protein
MKVTSCDIAPPRGFIPVGGANEFRIILDPAPAGDLYLAQYSLRRPGDGHSPDWQTLATVEVNSIGEDYDAAYQIARRRLLDSPWYRFIPNFVALRDPSELPLCTFAPRSRLGPLLRPHAFQLLTSGAEPYLLDTREVARPDAFLWCLYDDVPRT